MALPKQKKVTKDLYPSDILGKRMDKIIINSDPNTVFTPYTIDIELLDNEVLKLFKEGNLSTISNGKVIPTFFINNERWANFAKTWTFSNQDKNLLKPYIIVRRLNAEKGTRLGVKENSHFVQSRTFKYIVVGNYDGDEPNETIYKVKQPVNIDLSYEITIFTRYMIDLNKFDETIIDGFANIQSYISPFGNYMRLELTSEGQPETINQEDKETFYKKTYTVVLKAFIQKKENFEIVETIKRRSIIVSED